MKDEHVRDEHAVAEEVAEDAMQDVAEDVLRRT